MREALIVFIHHCCRTGASASLTCLEMVVVKTLTSCRAGLGYGLPSLFCLQ